MFTIDKEWIETEFTWNNAKADLPWENIDNASGTLGGGDHSIDPIAVTDCKGVGAWMSFDITETLKSIVDGNHINGFLFKEILNGTDNDFSEGCTFASSEADEVENRPKIVINYGTTAIGKNLSKEFKQLKFTETKSSFLFENINNKKKEISIYSISGRRIDSFVILQNKARVHKSDLSKGAFFIKVIGSNSEVFKVINK